MAGLYSDPKNDLVFKRVFGEHPKILRISLKLEEGMKAGIEMAREEARQAQARALEKLLARGMSPEEARSILGVKSEAD